MNHATIASAAATLALVTPVAVAGDGPGGVVSSGTFATCPWHLGVRSIGPMAMAGLTSMVPIPIILQDGGLRLHWPSTTSPAVKLGVPGGIGRIQWSGTTIALSGPPGTGINAWCVALGEDGTMHQWSNRGTAHAPQVDRWQSLAIGYSTVAGISQTGELHAWDFVRQLPITGAPSNPSSVAVGRSWGVAVDGYGRAHAMSFGSDSPPALATAEGVRQVAVQAVSTATSAATAQGRTAFVLRNSGQLVDGLGASMGAGPYKSIACMGAVASVIALREDGVAEIVSTAGIQRTIPGCYDSVWGGPSNSYAAIWSEDCDGNGEPDADQIRRGEIPDINGDLVDDRRQSPEMFPDDNVNGVPDLEETSSIGWRHDLLDSSWHLLGGSRPRRELVMSLQAITAGREVVDQVTWLAQFPSSMYDFPPTPATLHVWADPNRDGLPFDAVEILAREVTVSPGMNVFDVGPTRLGEHGDLVFVGIRWTNPTATFAGIGVGSWFPLVTSTAADPVLQSRRSKLLWFGCTTDWSVEPTEMARGQYRSRIASQASLDFTLPAESWQTLGILPYVGMGCSWAAPTDCDRNGLLDSLELASTTWAARIDVNGNGVIDACESDCDSDGTLDIHAVIAGAEDCDRDLVPDPCTFGESKLPDCDGDGTPDPCQRDDCDGNGIPDGCDLASGAADVDSNGVLDACQRDCDSDGVPDELQIARGALDCNGNGWIDSCESPDCDLDGTPDACQLLVQGDCNGNGILDSCDIASGLEYWVDSDGDGRIDACEIANGTETDCDSNGIVDSVDDPDFSDCDGDGQRDMCESDCDDDGIPDPCEVIDGAPDCNENSVPDSCEFDWDGDGTIDACEFDCNSNGIPDDREIAEQGAADIDGDGILDSCERARADLTLNGVVDGTDLGTLLGYWGQADPPLGDFDGNGVIDGVDLGFLLGNWGVVQW